MAWGLQQQPAGSATAAGSLPCLLLPAAVRSIPNKVLLNQVRCMNQLRCKLTLSAAKSHRSRNLVACSTSGSSAEVAQVRLLLFMATGLAPVWMMVVVVLRPCYKESNDVCTYG
ncbi:unnamed protein product [Urochloa decumbens]|uniref:Uncharacterized protein n=1 Tax=Urochloa decumbens TaxID=240449 RepID=A0ABC9EQM2_9POAL